MSNILKTKATQTKILTAQTSTNEAQTIEPVLGEFGACGGAGDVIAYNSMSNILKTKATQTKILTAQTSTNEAQTIEPVLGEFGACGGGGGGLVTSSPIIQCLIFYKPKQHKRNFYRHKPAQTKHKQTRLFGVNLEYVGGLSDLRMTYKYYFNI